MVWEVGWQVLEACRRDRALHLRAVVIEGSNWNCRTNILDLEYTRECSLIK